MVIAKRHIGDRCEEVAIRFLQQNGYTIIEKNFVLNHGEIDIVAKENETLVFIEVKTRRSKKFGAPEEAVTPKKQEIIRRTAEAYVVQKKLTNIDCRFDVVSVLLVDGKAECELFINCF